MPVTSKSSPPGSPRHQIRTLSSSQQSPGKRAGPAAFMKQCAMAILLSETDIRLLKDLRGAGERGRLISGPAPRVVARMLKAAYVTKRAVTSDSVVYSISPAGLQALGMILVEGG
jgi:hypothetical protein